MITKLEIENIRIFEGAWQFSLPPLSVFCGTNNSGKSTIIKTLLLLRQSQDIREPRSERQGKLGLVGQQVDFGNYSSLVSHNEIERDILIAVSIEDKMPATLYHILCRLHNEKLSSTEVVSYQLKARFSFGIKMEMANVPVLKKTSYEISVNGKNLLAWEVLIAESYEPNEPRYEIRIPNQLFLLLGESTEKSNLEMRCFKTSLKGILPFGLTMMQPLPPIIQEVTSDLEKALSDIHYLGPLRSPGKRHYVGSPNLDTDDPTGESIPFLLTDSAIYQSKIFHCLPNRKASKESLAKALNFWLYYLRTGKEPAQSNDNAEIDVSIKNDLYVEIKIKSVTETQHYPLIDSGFGYSQVLPILVKGLLAKPGQTLMVEQPELHLNPALQVRLAEFLVAMVRAGKQVLIETHSEHIIDAIRVLNVEDETGQLENMSRIFFIDIESDKPRVLPLDIQKDGSVPDWPPHFFGEAASLTGRLLRAQKRFRKRKV